MTTATNNGSFSPKNIGAIWIAHGSSGASGGFVKTLAVWARTRINHLTLWNSTTAAASLSRNTVDAVTSATLSSHQTHNVTWNCKDTTETVVPDGPYQVYFEMDDDNSTGPHTSVNFTKGSAAMHVAPPDTTNFKSISLTFTP